MSSNNILKKLILATALVAVTAMAQTPYDEGQKALREQNWTAAADQFEKAIKDDKDNADASMYWRAHALYKAGRSKEAERQVRSLERKYPESRWLKEARVLQIEHDSASALTSASEDALMDEELRMFALAQLMERDPDRALPLVLDALKSSGSEDVRSDTLFMLGMSDDPRAQEAIANIARDSSDPKLQADAIHMLGISSNQPSLDLLASLYRGSDSVKVKKAVIEAYMIADSSGDLVDTMVDLLRTEKNPELQKEIIHTLGLMDATDELRTLYPTLTDHETKVAALEALFLAGDTQTLRQVLDTETDPELRKTAIQGIAMEDDREAAAILEALYDKANSTDEKKVVLEALVLMDDAKDLAMKIVRTETDEELLREAIQMLGVMEATKEMEQLYSSLEEAELRKMVLESMMIADDSDGLVEILQSEKDPELRSAAIQSLALIDDDETGKFLADLYPQASPEEKRAIIESMMLMDNPESLINLMKTETDPELKREMLRILTLMDSDETDEYLFEMLENKG